MHKSISSQLISPESDSTKQKWTKIVSKIKSKRMNRAKIIPTHIAPQQIPTSFGLSKNPPHMKNKKISFKRILTS